MPEELFEQQSTAYLVMKQGPQMGKRVELWKDVTTIGRSRECDIFLEDLSAHRKQASILRTTEGYLLRDDEGKEIFPLEFMRNTPVPVAYFEKLHPVVYTAVESLEMEIFRANDKGADEAWLVEKQEELKVLWTSIFPYLSKVDQDFVNNGGYKILEL